MWSERITGGPDQKDFSRVRRAGTTEGQTTMETQKCLETSFDTSQEEVIPTSSPLHNNHSRVWRARLRLILSHTACAYQRFQHLPLLLSS